MYLINFFCCSLAAMSIYITSKGSMIDNLKPIWIAHTAFGRWEKERKERDRKESLPKSYHDLKRNHFSIWSVLRWCLGKGTLYHAFKLRMYTHHYFNFRMMVLFVGDNRGKLALSAINYGKSQWWFMKISFSKYFWLRITRTICLRFFLITHQYNRHISNWIRIHDILQGSEQFLLIKLALYMIQYWSNI